MKSKSNVDVRKHVLAAKAKVRAALVDLEQASAEVGRSHGEELVECVKALRSIANSFDADPKSRGLAKAALARLTLGDLGDLAVLKLSVPSPEYMRTELERWGWVETDNGKWKASRSARSHGSYSLKGAWG